MCQQRLSLLQNQAASTRLPPVHCQHASSTPASSSQVQEEALNFFPTAPTEQARAAHNARQPLAAFARLKADNCHRRQLCCSLHAMMQPALQVQRPVAYTKVCTFAGSGLCAPDIDAMPAVRWQVCSAHISVGLDSPRPPAMFATRMQSRYATHLGGHAGKVYALSDVDGYVRVADLWQSAEYHGHLIRSCGHRLGAQSVLSRVRASQHRAAAVLAVKSRVFRALTRSFRALLLGHVLKTARSEV